MISYVREFGIKNWFKHRARPTWTRYCWKHRCHHVPNHEWFFWECPECRNEWRSKWEIR